MLRWVSYRLGVWIIFTTLCRRPIISSGMHMKKYKQLFVKSKKLSKDGCESSFKNCLKRKWQCMTQSTNRSYKFPHPFPHFCVVVKWSQLSFFLFGPLGTFTLNLNFYFSKINSNSLSNICSFLCIVKIQNLGWDSKSLSHFYFYNKKRSLRDCDDRALTLVNSNPFHLFFRIYRNLSLYKKDFFSQ
jgi:hypothetical protein